MGSKNRKILFSILVLIFLFGGAYLIVLAQGLTLDFKNLKLVRMGGIYLDFTPRDASLNINGKPKKISLGIIAGGGLVKNLLPGDYLLTLTKPGFEKWEKKITVLSGMVEAETQIHLWPEKHNEEIIKSGIDDFWLSEKGIIYKDKNNKLIFNSEILRGNKIIDVNKKSQFIITSDEKNQFFIDLEKTKTSVNVAELFNSLKQRQLAFPGFVPIKKLLLHPFSPGKIIILTENSIYSLDTKKVELERLFGSETGLLSIALGNNDVLAIDENGQVFSYNLILRNLALLPIKISDADKIGASPNGSKILIATKDLKFLVYDTDLETLAKIDDGKIEFYPSPQNNAIAFIENKNLKIYFLEDYDLDFIKINGSSLEIPTGEENEISDYSWIPQIKNHFLILINGDLVIGEVDPRQPLNFHNLAGGLKKYILENKSVYALNKNGDLIKIDLEN